MTEVGIHVKIDDIPLPPHQLFRYIGPCVDIIGLGLFGQKAVFRHRCDDYGNGFSPNVANGMCMPSLRMEPVETSVSFAGNEEMGSLPANIVDEMACNRYFLFRLFAE